jgi:hypothetical protein
MKNGAAVGGGACFDKPYFGAIKEIIGEVSTVPFVAVPVWLKLVLYDQ